MGSAWRSGRLLGAIACVALASQAVPAQEGGAQQEVQGDPVRGRALSYTCLGCHGIPNYKNAYPTYRVPKLEGQHPEYIVIALQAYKSGERAHPTMQAQSATLSEQDMADIAAYFAGRPLQSGARARGELPAAAELCVACHGTDGVGITPQYPTLSGQHADYLEKALLDYKRGGRKNPVMAGFAQQLDDAQIRELARYYARQQPALETAGPRSPAVGRR